MLVSISIEWKKNNINIKYSFTLLSNYGSGPNLRVVFIEVFKNDVSTVGITVCEHVFLHSLLRTSLGVIYLLG